MLVSNSLIPEIKSSVFVKKAKVLVETLDPAVHDTYI